MQPCAAVYPPVNSSQPPTHETHLRTDSLSNGVEPLCPGSQTCRRETRACQTCCCGARTRQACNPRRQTRRRARETGDTTCTCCGSSQTRDTSGGKAHHTGSGPGTSACGQDSCEACASHASKARNQTRRRCRQTRPTTTATQASRGFQRQGARNSRAEAGLRQA